MKHSTILVIVILIILIAGGFLLVASSQDVLNIPVAPSTVTTSTTTSSTEASSTLTFATSSTVLPSVSVPSTTTASLVPTSNGTANITHSIDGVGVAPAEIIAGSAQSITVTALISDPAVIASGVNLIQIRGDGSSVVLGTLNPNGGGVFTLTTSSQALSLPIGNLDLRISAAFAGALKRVQSTDFPLQVDAPSDTSNWTPVSLSGPVTMKLPPGWQISGGVSSDGYDSYLFVIKDSSNIPVASIFAFTPQQWNTAQYGEAAPVFIAEANGLFYAEANSEASGPDWYSEGLGKQLAQILATFSSIDQ